MLGMEWLWWVLENWFEISDTTFIDFIWRYVYRWEIKKKSSLWPFILLIIFLTIVHSSIFQLFLYPLYKESFLIQWSRLDECRTGSPRTKSHTQKVTHKKSQDKKSQFIFSDFFLNIFVFFWNYCIYINQFCKQNISKNIKDDRIIVKKNQNVKVTWHFNLHYYN